MEWYETELMVEVIKVILQLILLGIVGGWISWLYTKWQKNREIKVNLIRELSEIQGNFLTIRYKFNTFHVNWGKDKIMKVAEGIKDKELEQLKWKYYEEVCDLIGKYQGMKPLLIEFFPKEKQNINYLHEKYQDWRRHVREDKPIFQSIGGKTDKTLNEIKSNFQKMISEMRKNI